MIEIRMKSPAEQTMRTAEIVASVSSQPLIKHRKMKGMAPKITAELQIVGIQQDHFPEALVFGCLRHFLAACDCQGC